MPSLSRAGWRETDISEEDSRLQAERPQTAPEARALAMLLFVKRPFAEAIRTGQKTLEIRAGARYARIAPGDTLSINGRFRVRVLSVERVETRVELLKALRGRHEQAGCATAASLRDALRDCYPDERGPYIVLSIGTPID